MIGLVYVLNVRGVVVGYLGSWIDCYGYVVIFNLLFYQLNSVDFDFNGMVDEIELWFSLCNVVFIVGVVVCFDYLMWVVRFLLVDSWMFSGEFLLFVVEVFDVYSGQLVGVVGQGSCLVLWVEQDCGLVWVCWGNELQQQCLVDYVLGLCEMMFFVL